MIYFSLIDIYFSSILLLPMSLVIWAMLFAAWPWLAIGRLVHNCLPCDAYSLALALS